MCPPQSTFNACDDTAAHWITLSLGLVAVTYLQHPADAPAAVLPCPGIFSEPAAVLRLHRSAN